MANFILTEEYKIQPLTMQNTSSPHPLPRRKKYNIISNDLRRKIIDRLSSNSVPLKQVSKEFNIKLSTCKAILHVFQKEGRFEKKKKRIRKPKFQQSKANSNSCHINLYDKSLSWLIFPDLDTFLNRFPKLKPLFEKKPIKNMMEEETIEETSSDILTNTSHIGDKHGRSAKLSVGKCLYVNENETNTSFFSEEGSKTDLVVLKNMWEKILEHFSA